MKLVHRVVKSGLPLFCLRSELVFGQLPVLRMHKQPPLGTAQVVLLRSLCCLIPTLCFVERVFEPLGASSCSAGILEGHTLSAVKFKRWAVPMHGLWLSTSCY